MMVDYLNDFLEKKHKAENGGQEDHSNPEKMAGDFMKGNMPKMPTMPSFKMPKM